MSDLRRGLYRIEIPGIEDEVQVEDVNGGSETHIPKSLYQARGYEPPYEDLPSLDEYFAKGSSLI
jgi:hypothetical protein